MTKSVAEIPVLIDNEQISSFVDFDERKSLERLPKGYAISVALIITLSPF